MVQQRKPEQNQEPAGQPKQPQDNPHAGRNQTAQQAQKDDGQEVVGREGGTASWGNLPEYLGAIKQRGGVPEVSEKYRKLYDAYLKAQAKKPTTGR